MITIYATTVLASVCIVLRSYFGAMKTAAKYAETQHAKDVVWCFLMQKVSTNAYVFYARMLLYKHG